MSKMQGEFQPMLWTILFLLCFHLLASFELLEQVFLVLLCTPFASVVGRWLKDGYEVPPDC